MPKTAALQKDPDAVKALKNLKDKVQSGIQRYRGARADLRPQRLPHMNDFSRLARRICGKSIGLVLGGGGARGVAHLVSNALTDMFDCSGASQGLIRALEEYEIPIDHIAGKLHHHLSSATTLRLVSQVLAWALSLVDFMLAREI